MHGDTAKVRLRQTPSSHRQHIWLPHTFHQSSFMRPVCYNDYVNFLETLFPHLIVEQFLLYRIGGTFSAAFFLSLLLFCFSVL